jgi:hypothetical protein
MNRMMTTALTMIVCSPLLLAGCGAADTGTEAPAGSESSAITLNTGGRPPACILAGTHEQCTTRYVCSGLLCLPETTCACVANPAPVAVATNINDVEALAEDSTNLYWTAMTATEATAVYSCPKVGCTTPKTVYPGGTSIPAVMAVDASYVYWTDYGAQTIMRCAKTGCTTPTTLASGQVMPNSIAVDSSYVYWANEGNGFVNGSVMRCAVGGCGGNPTVLAANQSSAWGMISDANNLYYYVQAPNYSGQYIENIMQLSKSGGAPIQLAVGNDVFSLAVDSTSVYWANAVTYPTSTTQGLGSIAKCAIGGCGGTPTILASGQTEPMALAVTDGNAYWIGPDNGTNVPVMRCPTAGCNNAPASVATVENTVGNSYRFISDSTHLYMGGTGANSSIWSLAAW